MLHEVVPFRIIYRSLYPNMVIPNHTSNQTRLYCDFFCVDFCVTTGVPYSPYQNSLEIEDDISD